MNLSLLPGRYAVCRVDEAPRVEGEFFCVTRTADELSVICEERFVPEGAQCEPGWRVMRFAGTLPFTDVGVLASVLNPLRDADIPVLTVSTFGTDYVLVKDSDFSRAKAALVTAGHAVFSS